MNFDAETGVLKFNKRVLLGPGVTKTELFNNTNVRWEGWPEKKAIKQSHTELSLKVTMSSEIYI